MLAGNKIDLRAVFFRHFSVEVSSRSITDINVSK